MTAMKFRRLVFGAAILFITAPLAAQAPAVAPSWNTFLGCWSTSSAGSIGPMVCIVPTDSVDRVEFLTVNGDSIVSRSFVDASGRLSAYARNACRGVETARWSADGNRVYLHADYSCGKGAPRQSDALIDRTRSDAFSYLEVELKSEQKPVVVNFIVQLDTTVFPDEVRRRLPAYRALTLDATELEERTAVPTSALVEAKSILSPALIEAWMSDRGESAVFAIAVRPRRNEVEFSQLRRRHGLQRATLFTTGSPGDTSSSQSSWGVNWGGYYPTNYLVTPAMVGFGLPYADYPGGFTWRGWP